MLSGEIAIKNNHYYYYYYYSIWNRLPCSAVSHVIPSLDNFHKFAMPAIRVMQGHFYLFFIYFFPIVNNSVLFASYSYIFS